ncbi:MAG: Helix-turn-helix domain [Acidobacteriota bacterium]|jgi:transcriptional regulator with XRE-family HTH domain|nr:Helix-turn-helix domain [Acidobacteriota bacterium]
MGGKARPKPKRLAEKLLQIRIALGLSQNEMIQRLGVDLTQNRISDYELDMGEPPLPVLLKYARVAGVCLDSIVDDEIDLPSRLPGKPKHPG